MSLPPFDRAGFERELKTKLEARLRRSGGELGPVLEGVVSEAARQIAENYENVRHSILGVCIGPPPADLAELVFRELERSVLEPAEAEAEATSLYRFVPGSVKVDTSKPVDPKTRSVNLTWSVQLEPLKRPS
jgi:hypothetical protein